MMGQLQFKKRTTNSRRRFRHGGVRVDILQLLVPSNGLADIDLTSMIPSLDSTASEIVQYQRDSTVQRKDLAQKTKDFRKLDDSGKLGEIKGLLKGRWSTEVKDVQSLILS